MFKRLISNALIFGAAALAPPAQAQTAHCLPRDALVQKLTSHYSERMTGAGLQTQEQLLEIWSSDKTGSFTVFVTRPDGLSCIMATGKHWHTAITRDVEGVTG